MRKVHNAIFSDCRISNEANVPVHTVVSFNGWERLRNFELSGLLRQKFSGALTLLHKNLMKNYSLRNFCFDYLNSIYDNLKKDKDKIKNQRSEHSNAVVNDNNNKIGDANSINALGATISKGTFISITSDI
jgi:hypothetical protein